MDPICFNNQYGKATLTPVTDTLPLSEVSFAKMPALVRQVRLTVEQAEQLALISENKDIQICFNMHEKLHYVVFHVTANTVWLCQANIDYIGVDGFSPAGLIELLRTQSIAA